MNKPLRTSQISIQKRRSNVALCIRLVIFLGVTTVYLASNYYQRSNDDSTFFSHENNRNYNGRKLLSIAENKSISGIEEFPKQSTAASLNLTRTTLSKLPAGSNYVHSTVPTITELTGKESNATNGTLSPLPANCTPPAIDEFPPDGFTREQRKHGWIVVHILLACYCFWLLAAVCDDYFVPAIELMCFNFQLKEDVVGATFMAAATSSPELFINCVGTFVTKGDIGVGTIVGSAVFNILAVPACCGLFAGQVVNLDWWPVTRDSLMYCAAVLGLIGTLYDGKVMWYEALILVLAYFFYMSAMYCNDAMARKARKLIAKCRRKSKVRPFREVNEITPLLSSTINNNHCPLGKMGCSSGLTADMLAQSGSALQMQSPIFGKCDKSTSTSISDSVETMSSDVSDYADDPWFRGDSGICRFVLRWPITLLLWITVPDCRKRPNWKFITFFLSVAWIGGISYIVAYLITIVGDTLNIPDSVMGLTILAAGMSIPEAVSSVIVTNQGHGAMGISNSIGSNTFDILLCLGLPWFIKAYFVPAVPDEQWVLLNSSGLTYSAISLLTTLFGLYIAFAANKFRLDWKIGVACTVMYIGFLILASMIELNVFFDVNLPVCDH